VPAVNAYCCGCAEIIKVCKSEGNLAGGNPLQAAEVEGRTAHVIYNAFALTGACLKTRKY
jgi:hypothetical protein